MTVAALNGQTADRFPGRLHALTPKAQGDGAIIHGVRFDHHLRPFGV